MEGLAEEEATEEVLVVVVGTAEAEADLGLVAALAAAVEAITTHHRSLLHQIHSPTMLPVAQSVDQSSMFEM